MSVALLFTGQEYNFFSYYHLTKLFFGLSQYACQLSQELREIYNYRPKRHERMEITRGKVLTRLARWYNKVEALGIKYFNTVIQTMQHNYDTIINYFEHRSTNASAESFNAKIKAFRSQLRGIRDIPFFMFRLEKLFA